MEPKTIETQNEKWSKLKEEYDAEVTDNRFTMDLVHEDGDLKIWKEVYNDGESISINFTSSVHWTDSPVTLRYNKRFNRTPEWDLRYGSGGTIGVADTQIAKVMSKIFQLAEAEMQTKPF